MTIATTTASSNKVEADALIFLVFEGTREERFGAGELIDSGEVTGKALELTLIHHPQGVAAKRLLLAGAGKAEKFDAPTLRRVSGAAVRHLKTKSIKKIAIVLDPSQADAANVAAAVEGAILGSFEPDRYKTDDDKKSIESFTVAVEGGTPDLAGAAERGRILAEAQNFTRDLVNEPANLLTPLLMAEAASKWRPSMVLSVRSSTVKRW
ncbi:MAG: M17 family peptidase N-terminal domain-containing protein [Ignavibacteriota bacterium]